MADEEKELTEDQRRFVREYAIDRNGTQAYRRVFGEHIGCRVAQNGASRLLAKAIIKSELEAAEKEHARRCSISARRVLREIASLAFADIGDAFDDDKFNADLPKPRPLTKMPAATRRAIQSVKVKRRKLKGEDDEIYEIEEIEYKLADKLSALEKLCKHLGLTSDGSAIEKLLAMIEEEKRGGDAKPQS